MSNIRADGRPTASPHAPPWFRRRSVLVTASALIGIGLGILSARCLPQGNPLVTIPWGVAAFLFGVAARTRSQGLLAGAIIGFAASYSYLWFDDTDSLTPAKALRLAFIILIPATFGLLCGAGAAFLGTLLGKVLPKRF